MNLRLCNYELTEHAQSYMRRLGIQYKLAVPQSMGDQWWFFGCTNVPAQLPDCFSVITKSPRELIGYGLSKEDADHLSTP